ncbi:MAG: PilZ domain-containing protein [Desulfobacteraceae bacterium]|nr:MAG: PilZ domain-containing protein [Desulfobacteraceae bacterium]
MNDLKKPKILLIADTDALLKIYMDQLSAYDVDITTLCSVKDLQKTLCEDAYNGIIIDLKTKLAAPREQRETAYEVLEQYPVLQSRIHPGSEKIQAIPFGKAKNEVSLKEFLTELCPHFSARKIRTSPRRIIHFNVLLSKSGDFDAETMERTFTINLSQGGCFIASSKKWSAGEQAAFVFKELSIHTPMVGEIRWHVPWGRSMAVPGIGIKFVDIEMAQLEELSEKYELGRPNP